MWFFSVIDGFCNDKYPECRRIGGTCGFYGEDKNVICSCKAGITYDKSNGCKIEFNRNYKFGYIMRLCTQKCMMLFHDS